MLGFERKDWELGHVPFRLLEEPLHDGWLMMIMEYLIDVDCGKTG